LKADPARQRVEELFAELRDTKLPKAHDEGARDIISDLAEGDGYVAGLADAYLETGSPRIREIRIDVSIPRRIDRLGERVSQSEVEAIRRFLRLIDDLAKAVSDASGVPLVRWDSEREERDRRN
jgi:hypothetical protein